MERFFTIIEQYGQFIAKYFIMAKAEKKLDQSSENLFEIIKYYMRRILRKQVICICENKGADKLCGKSV